ncbi:IS66 family insertion sequence element accessory protein TnpB [Pseudomonas protegens]
MLYWETNDFCLWLKRLEAGRFRSHHDHRKQPANTPSPSSG